MLYPAILVSMIYFAVGLSSDPLEKYPILCMKLLSIFIVLNYALVYWHASGYGLMLSVIIPKIEIAMSIAPLFSVSFSACAGYFTTQNTIPFVLQPFKYLSFFRYGFVTGLMV